MTDRVDRRKAHADGCPCSEDITHNCECSEQFRIMQKWISRRLYAEHVIGMGEEPQWDDFDQNGQTLWRIAAKQLIDKIETEREYLGIEPCIDCQGAAAEMVEYPNDREIIEHCLESGHIQGYYLTGTKQLVRNVHTYNSECVANGCPIHSPSNHHMKDWPTHWRDPNEPFSIRQHGLMERMCPHGVGHPDPDHIAFTERVRGEEEANTESVHGCDGCCAPTDNPPPQGVLSPRARPQDEPAFTPDSFQQDEQYLKDHGWRKSSKDDLWRCDRIGGSFKLENAWTKQMEFNEQDNARDELEARRRAEEPPEPDLSVEFGATPTEDGVQVGAVPASARPGERQPAGYFPPEPGPSTMAWPRTVIVDTQGRNIVQAMWPIIPEVGDVMQLQFEGRRAGYEVTVKVFDGMIVGDPIWRVTVKKVGWVDAGSHR